jgi:hypothetical protein
MRFRPKERERNLFPAKTDFGVIFVSEGKKRVQSLDPDASGRPPVANANMPATHAKAPAARAGRFSATPLISRVNARRRQADGG